MEAFYLVYYNYELKLTHGTMEERVQGEVCRLLVECSTKRRSGVTKTLWLGESFERFYKARKESLKETKETFQGNKDNY